MPKQIGLRVAEEHSGELMPSAVAANSYISLGAVLEQQTESLFDGELLFVRSANRRASRADQLSLTASNEGTKIDREERPSDVQLRQPFRGDDGPTQCME